MYTWTSFGSPALVRFERIVNSSKRANKVFLVLYTSRLFLLKEQMTKIGKKSNEKAPLSCLFFEENKCFYIVYITPTFADAMSLICMPGCLICNCITLDTSMTGMKMYNRNFPFSTQPRLYSFFLMITGKYVVLVR